MSEKILFTDLDGTLLTGDKKIPPALQKRMGDFSASGGRLVYSTCSIEPEENHELVQLLLERHPGCQLVDERLVLPHRDRTDGAYSALLRAPRID